METWHTGELSFPNFLNFTSHRKKSKKAKRNSGGILFIYKKQYKGLVTKLESKSEDILWVKLDKRLFNHDKDIYLASVYISPKGSTVHSNRTYEIFDILEEEIAYFNDLGEILVGGDFNARVGTIPDYIENDTPIDMQTLPINYDFDHPLSRNNMDDGQPNVFGKNLIDLCINSKLRILNGRTPGDLLGKPTCYQPNGCSVVDYVLASETILLRKTTFFHVHALSPFSDHCKISLLLESSPNLPEHIEYKLPTRPFHKFVWNADSKEKFIKIINSTMFYSRINQFMHKNYELTPECLDTALQDFIRPLQEAGRNSLSLRITKKRKQQYKKQKSRKRWFDQTCASARQELKNLGRLLSKDPRNPSLRGSYFKKKKLYTRLIRKTKKEFKDNFLKQLNSYSDNNPSSFWSLLKDFKSNNNNNNKMNTQDLISDEKLHAHFKNLYGEESNPVPDASISPGSFEMEIKNKISKLENDLKDNLLDSQILSTEISKAISNLKNGKASGSDLILNEMLKCSPHTLIKPLTKLFNLFLSSGYFPQNWCTSHIVALHKGGSKDDPSNYRGISVTSCLAKLFTSILNTRLTTFLDDNKLISPNQAGFRKLFSTNDNLFVLDSLITKYFHNNKRLYTCFIDFRKAFDTVWKEGLRFKLLNSGIGGNFYKLIKCLYSKPETCVKTKSGLTPPFVTDKGFRQGCNLSPTLFNLYINDLVKELDNSECMPPALHNLYVSCLLYADDVVILSESDKGLQSALNRLSSFCDKWKLRVNLKKTKVVIFNKAGRCFPKQKYYFENNTIDSVPSYCYLGLTLTSLGSFTLTKKQLSLKARKAIYSFKSIIRSSVSPRSLLKIFDTCVKPILLYGCQIWGTEQQHDTSPIENVHNQFCKNILGVFRNSSNIACRAELGRFPLDIDICIYIVKFWLRLVQMETTSHPLQMDALLLQHSLPTNTRRRTSLQRVKDILDHNGYSFLWHSDNSRRDPEHVVKMLRSRLTDMHIQTFFIFCQLIVVS
ncbi:uncharacterized protein LOC144904189 [Branchiostoma floridae x Branchiostoma belcheri]